MAVEIQLFYIIHINNPIIQHIQTHNIELPAKSFSIPMTPKIVRILGIRRELQCGTSSIEDTIHIINYYLLLI